LCEPRRRIAAGKDAFHAGYGSPGILDPAKLEITNNLCEPELSDLKSDRLPVAYDQTMCSCAQKSEAASHLPIVHPS
jgi:hypothetical protein